MHAEHIEKETMMLYKGNIPDFVEDELDRLYGARYATWPHFNAVIAQSAASTFTLARSGETLAIILFSVRTHVLTVLNEGILMDGFIIKKFTEFMFRENPELHVICMNAVEIDRVCLDRPHHRTICASDLTMRLPVTHDWMSTLSPQYRSQIRRNIKRMAGMDATFVFELFEKEAVDPRDVRAILALHQARMAGKNKRSTIDDHENEKIIDFVRQRGFVGMIRLKGKLCAGVIVYRLGKNYALRMLGHDSAYNQYSIGATALVLTIERAAMQHTGGTFFFGWGDEAYKFRLGARKRELWQLVIYRTPMSLLQNLPLAARALWRAATLRTRQWVRRMRAIRVPWNVSAGTSRMMPG